MLVRDKETHGEVHLVEGVRFRVLQLHAVCHWCCHLDFHPSFVVALDVSEKFPEGSSAGVFGSLAW